MSLIQVAGLGGYSSLHASPILLTRSPLDRVIPVRLSVLYLVLVCHLPIAGC